jgi:glycerophosphoryl diester phosphodiesterase
LKSPRDHPVIVAHRGDSFHAPENTLDAARLAWEAEAQAWELDVQLTRDGIPIVIHDESLLRTTDVAARFAGDPRRRDGFRVSDFDWDEIQTLDAGSWFVAEDGGPRSARAFGVLESLDPQRIEHYRSRSVSIPTLKQALLLTKELKWLVNVEIKSLPERPPGLVHRVLDDIAATGIADRVLISSFDHEAVAVARCLGREYTLGILTEIPLYRIHDYASELIGADTVHVCKEILGSGTISYRRECSATALRHDIVTTLKGRDISILVYTVNDQGGGSLARHLTEIGVSGLFTDDPRGLKRRFAADPPTLTDPERERRSASPAP